MKIKSFKEKYEKGIEKQKPIKTKLIDRKWVVTIILTTFILSLLLSLLSELIIPSVYFVISLMLILVFIFLGIIFDIIGLAVATADSKIFHSMATKKVKGAKTAIKLIKNRDRMSSFCNDVIGDICGVISGSCGLSVAIKLSELYTYNVLIVTILITSIITSLTIGGKALGKSFAVNKNNYIVFEVSKVISPFIRKKKK